MLALIDADQAYRDKKNAVSRAWYANAKKDPAWYAARQAAYKLKRQQLKQQAIDFLGGKCQDCQQIYPQAVYDFHHLDPTKKDFHIGTGVCGTWNQKLRDELAKCILLCANCHRKRHIC